MIEEGKGSGSPMLDFLFIFLWFFFIVIVHAFDLSLSLFFSNLFLGLFLAPLSSNFFSFKCSLFFFLIGRVAAFSHDQKVYFFPFIFKIWVLFCGWFCECAKFDTVSYAKI